MKGHLRSSCKISWKCENLLIWKVEVQFEPKLVWWHNMGPWYVHAVKRSQIKVKGHLRSTCKTTWKHKFGLICILEDQLELPNRCGDQGQMLTCIIHNLRRQEVFFFSIEAWASAPLALWFLSNVLGSYNFTLVNIIRKIIGKLRSKLCFFSRQCQPCNLPRQFTWAAQKGKNEFLIFSWIDAGIFAHFCLAWTVFRKRLCDHSF